jgi:hypothetical protein
MHGNTILYEVRKLKRSTQGMKFTTKGTPLVALIVLLMVFLLMLSPVLPDYTFALSPPFARQDIINNHNQWAIEQVPQNYTLIDIPPGYMKLAKKVDECKTEQRYPRLPGISAATYFSDGKTLNTTLWLSNPLLQPPSNASVWLRPPFKEIPWFHMGYYVSIHAHSVYDSGASESVGIEWDVQNSTWTKTVREYSPLGDEKILNQKYNYSIPVGKDYIELPFDLKHVNYPDLYDILFYSTDMYVKDGRLCK